MIGIGSTGWVPGILLCGNSAIAAVSPVIGADSEDVSASIAFTAVLGVIVVLSLPLLAGAWHLNRLQYGVLAGLTVYAVPQVLAATAPLGPVAVQMGTLVKLVRVLMLGPVVLGLALLARRWATNQTSPDRSSLPETARAEGSCLCITLRLSHFHYSCWALSAPV